VNNLIQNKRNNPRGNSASLSLVNTAFAERIILQSLHFITRMIICHINCLDANIAENSGQSTGLVIDTYIHHSYLDTKREIFVELQDPQ
jgi:hypothetical protein